MDHDTIIVGAGFAGMYMLHSLRQAGFTARDDTLPERLLKVPHKSGPAKGVTVHLEEMLPVYYRTRGWDAQGVPTREKLAELGLASV